MLGIKPIWIVLTIAIIYQFHCKYKSRAIFFFLERTLLLCPVSLTVSATLGKYVLPFCLSLSWSGQFIEWLSKVTVIVFISQLLLFLLCKISLIFMNWALQQDSKIMHYSSSCNDVTWCCQLCSYSHVQEGNLFFSIPITYSVHTVQMSLNISLLLNLRWSRVVVFLSGFKRCWEMGYAESPTRGNLTEIQWSS